MLALVLSSLVVYVTLTNAAGCCLPEAVEGRAHGYSAKGNGTFFDTFSYDFANRRMRVDTFDDFEGVRHRQTVWEEMDRSTGNNVLYHFSKGVCTVVKLGTPFQKACIPENHGLETHLTIGGSLNAARYGFREQTIGGEFIVGRDTCLPIHGMFFEHHRRNFKFDYEIDYWNVQLGIGNPIVFELPSQCRSLIQ